LRFTAYLNRWPLSHLPAATVLLSVALSSVFLLLMFLTVPNWPFSGMGLLVSLVLLCMVISWVALQMAKRLMAPVT